MISSAVEPLLKRSDNILVRCSFSALSSIFWNKHGADVCAVTEPILLHCKIWIFVGFSVAGIPTIVEASWSQCALFGIANIDLDPSALLSNSSWCNKLRFPCLSGDVGKKCVKTLGVHQMGSIDGMQSAALRHWEPGSSCLSCLGALSRVDGVEFSWQCC